MRVNESSFLVDRLSAWVRLAQIMLVLPVGSIENERAFSAMNYLKSSVRNSLQEPHLNACMRIFRSKYTFQAFPMDSVLHEFLGAKDRRMLTAVA